MHNATDYVLTAGIVAKYEVNPPSYVDVAGLEPGATKQGTYESGEFIDSNYTAAFGVCYNHTSWSTKPVGTARGKLRDTYIFADANGKLFLTPEGGHDDQDMWNTGTC